MSTLKSIALKLLIRVLTRWLDVPTAPKDQQVEDFLAGAWMSPGFRKYVANRDAKIVRQLAGGDGMTERTRDDYIRFIGQRAENLILGAQAKKAFLAQERESRKKMSTAPKSPTLQNG